MTETFLFFFYHLLILHIYFVQLKNKDILTDFFHLLQQNFLIKLKNWDVLLKLYFLILRPGL